jgi:gas vesicle protein
LDTSDLLTAIVAVIGAIVAVIGAATSFYAVWLSRHKARAEAHKLDEEAETEDTAQRSTDVASLGKIIEQWQSRCGQLVKDQDALRESLEAEITHRRTIESEAAKRIRDIETRAALEHEARLAAEQRAQGQASLLIKLQQEVESWRARQSELEYVVREFARGIEILLEQLNGASITPAWLPEEALLQTVATLGVPANAGRQ